MCRLTQLLAGACFPFPFSLLLCVVQDVLDALPLAGAFWLTLLIHEAGHRQVMRWQQCCWSMCRHLACHASLRRLARSKQRTVVKHARHCCATVVSDTFGS
jgi:hypothetical protein